MEKKHLLFFHFDLCGGGAEKVLVNLVNGLNKDKYDITLLLLFGRGVNIKNLSPNIKLKYIFKRPIKGITILLKLFPPALLHKIFIKDKYDVEIAYIEYAPTRIIAGCKNRDTKLIAWVHSKIKKIPGVFLSYKEMESCYKKFEKIVFVADEAKETFEKTTGWHDLPYTILPNVMDFKFITESSKENIKENINNDIINICSIGKLEDSKGAMRLAKALCNLYNKGIKNWHLYYLGIGSQEESINRLFHKYSANNHVTFLGYQKNPYKYLSKMSLFVCPSYSEGYSTSTIEALILKVPVLITDCGGMKQITENGKYGKLVANTDSELEKGLQSLICNSEELLKYKKKAEERSEFFLPEKVLSITEKMIDNL